MGVCVEAIEREIQNSKAVMKIAGKESDHGRKKIS